MASVAAPRRSSQSNVGEAATAYGFITPAILAMVIASFIPIAFTIFVGFTNWDGTHPALVDGFHFVGLANYRTILDNLQGEVIGVVAWTLIFAAVSTVV